jgi:cysteine protease ATG4
VFILTRIGLDEPNPDYLKVLDDIMEMSSFQGIVGGSPSRALYILGRVGSHYIYLDPHYVQVPSIR